MLETSLIACILAKIKGYKLSVLLKCYLLYPLILLELIHISFQISVFMGNYHYTQYAPLLKKGYLLALLLPMIAYKLYTQGLLGSLCILIGTFLNQLVIRANGGKMPVYPTLSYHTGFITSESFDLTHTIHVLGTQQHPYKLLADIIDLGYTILSVGDLFIHAFTGIMIYYVIKELQLTGEKKWK